MEFMLIRDKLAYAQWKYWRYGVDIGVGFTIVSIPMLEDIVYATLADVYF